MRFYNQQGGATAAKSQVMAGTGIDANNIRLEMGTTDAGATTGP